MLDLAKVQCANFAACVNQDFEIVTSSGTVVLKLFEARSRPAPDAGRDPFTLTFRGAPELRLPQGIYRLSNAQLARWKFSWSRSPPMKPAARLKQSLIDSETVILSEVEGSLTFPPR